MRSAGEERLITALVSLPKLNASAILRVLPTVIKNQAKEELFRYYITDWMYYTSRQYTLNERFYDKIQSMDKPRDTRSAEEIADDIINKAGLEVTT